MARAMPQFTPVFWCYCSLNKMKISPFTNRKWQAIFRSLTMATCTVRNTISGNKTWTQLKFQGLNAKPVLLKSGRQMRLINSMGNPEPHSSWSGRLPVKLLKLYRYRRYINVQFRSMFCWGFFDRWTTQDCDGRPSHPPRVGRPGILLFRNHCKTILTVVYFTKEVKTSFAKLPLIFNGGLAKLGLTSFAK